MRVFLMLVFTLLAGEVFAQSHSQVFDYAGFNTYWNGTSWASHASGYGNVLGPNTGTGDFTFYSSGNNASAGLAVTLTPVMTVTAAGTVSASHFVGDGSGLTGVGGSGDRIVSGSLSILAASASSTVYITGLAQAAVSVSNSGGYNLVLVDSDVEYATGNGGGVAFAGGTSGVGGWNTFGVIKGQKLNSNSGDVFGGIGFYTRGPTTLTEKMRVTYDGKVGIATTAPATALDVSGTISATNVKIAGTMQLGVYTSQPVACGAGYIGLMAMNSATDVCVCNGTSWNRVSSGGTACSW